MQGNVLLRHPILVERSKDLKQKKSSKQRKKLGITGPCFTSTFFRRKQLYWVRVSDNAEDVDILMQNRLGEPFSCILHSSEKTVFFWSNFLFHGQNIKYLHWARNPPTGLELDVMDFALGKSCLQSNPYSLPLYSHSPILNSKSRWRLLQIFLNFALDCRGSYFFSRCEAKEMFFFPD